LHKQNYRRKSFLAFNIFSKQRYEQLKSRKVAIAAAHQFS